MNLTFNSITISNFMSIRYETIPLKNMGYTIISGRNHRTNDNSLSNGSGKSSIFNAVCYALTGETSQGLRNNIENIYANPNDCWVELNFDVDKTNFVVRRIKTPKSDMKIYINGVDSSGKGIVESNKILNNYLPDLTSMLIGSIIILGQGLPYRFADNHPGGRKEILEKLTKSDFMIQMVKDKLDDRQSVLKNFLRVNEDNLVANNTQQKMYHNQVENLKSQLQAIIDYNNEYSLDSRIDYINEKLVNLKAAKEQCDSLNSEYMNLIESTYAKKSELVNDRNKEQSKAIEELTDKITDLKADLSSKQTLKTTTKKEIEKRNNMPDICPTCGQFIPKGTVDTTHLQMQLTVIEEKIKSIKDEIHECTEEKNNIIDEFDKVYAQKQNDLDIIISDSRNKLNTNQSELNEVNKKLQKYTTELAKVQMMKENELSIKQSIVDIDEKLEKLATEKETLNNNINDSQLRLRIIQNLITLTKKEFRSVLLENVVLYLNKRVQQYSLQVFGNSLLSITANDNAIDIMFDGRYYESLSGGEKQKIDIIIQLALKDLLSAHLGLRTNIIVLDEIFDNLDQAGCQKILDVLSTITDIESIFIISHHTTELQLSYDTEIVVEKDNDGVSHISIK